MLRMQAFILYLSARLHSSDHTSFINYLINWFVQHVSTTIYGTESANKTLSY